MHTEKQEIFDKYAKTIGYQDWRELLADYSPYTMLEDSEFQIHVLEACDLVQQEQQKRIADKLPKEGKSLLYCAGVKDTILNPENLIK